MDRVVLSAGSSLTPPAPESGTVSNRFYTDASIFTPFAAHMLTEEQRNVVVAAGLTPSRTELDQLKEAIDILSLAQALSLPYAPIKGCTLSNASGDLVNDIRVAPGVIVANDNTGIIRLNSILIKKLDASWAAGTNAGGLLTGTKAASTTYHVFALLNPASGAVDVGFDTGLDPTSVLPAGYTKWARIGSLFTTSGSAWCRFDQVSRDFRLLDPVEQTGSVTTTRTLYTVAVPAGLKVKADFSVLWRTTGPTGGVTVVVTDPDLTNVAPTLGNSSFAGGAAGEATDDGAPIQLWTNASGQIGIRCGATGGTPTGTIYVNTRGWFDPLDQQE